MEQSEIIKSIIEKTEKANIFNEVELEFLNQLIKSPFRKTYMAMAKQLEALNDETILRPFTIRFKKEESMSAEDVLTEATLTQKYAETQLKYMKERFSFAEDVEKMRNMLTPEEQESVNKVVTATSLRKEIVGKAK